MTHGWMENKKVDSSYLFARRKMRLDDVYEIAMVSFFETKKASELGPREGRKRGRKGGRKEERKERRKKERKKKREKKKKKVEEERGKRYI